MECAALAQPQATPLPFQTGQIWGGVERDQAWRIINYKTLLVDAVVFWLGGLPAANGAGRIRVPGMARIRRSGIGQGVCVCVLGVRALLEPGTIPRTNAPWTRLMRVKHAWVWKLGVESSEARSSPGGRWQREI